MENILETKKYDKFKFCSWNRAISEKNLQKLDKEVQKNGWKKHPIIVNENYEVIDGQHRLIYAKQHDFPIYYVVINGLDVRDCVIMNNSRIQWTPLDFIKLYAEQGNENYIRLKELLEGYTFAPVSQIVALIKGQGGNGNLSNILRRGEYTLTELEAEAVKAKLDYLEETYQYTKLLKGRLASLNKVIAFCYDCEEVDNERLKTQLENRVQTMIPPANIDMAVEEIDKVYNYRIGQGNYVDIISIYRKHAREQMLNGSRAFSEASRLRRGE